MDEPLTSDAAPPTPEPPANPASSASASQSPQPQAEILADVEFQDYIKQYPFAAEPTYFTRPNRFYGPASTWRSWTANDRAVVDALDDARAADLGVHLYNAFALKRRAGYVAGARKGRSKSRGRADGDGDGEEVFVPPETWTAWPLRGSQVPRREGYESVRPGEAVRPSSAMEEALIAVMVRHAKERWDGRKIAPPEVKVKREKRNWHVERGDDDDDVNRSLGMTHDEEDPEASNAEILSSSDDDSLPQGIQTFSSQAFAVDESSSSSEDTPSDDEGNQPVFSADDDHARRILRPSTRHILSKLDDLLVGLHKARKAYSIRKHSSRSRSRSRAPETGDTEGEQTRGRKRKWSATSESSPVGQSASRSRGRSTTRQYGVKGRSLGLRDWSDVLGMAALTGWNTDTVARASERCGRLFGENMMFRTFREAGDLATGQTASEPNFDETYALGSDTEYVPAHDNKRSTNTPERSSVGFEMRARSEISAYIPARSEPLGERVLSCPVQSCKQHEYVYTRSTRLYEHIRTVHPEFDLESFKRIMAKGGKRGRYDRSFIRSRSRSKNRREEGEGDEEDEHGSSEKGLLESD